MPDVRTRFWIESALAAASAVLAAVTVVWSNWIELIFGVDPDHASGGLEWLIVALLVTTTVVFAALARTEWRTHG